MPSTIDIAEKPVAVQGIGAGGYSAIDFRGAAATLFGQEGVLDAGDFKVTPGGGLTLNVAAGRAAVEGDSVVQQGRYYQRMSAAIAGTLTLVNPPDAAQPRIDQVVLEIKDNQHDASGLNTGRIRVVQGTPTAGATLDNRTGAAALPSTAIRLIDLLVPAAFAGPFVAGTHVRDRRPWARGAHARIADTTADVALGGIATIGSAYRIETSGAPLRVSIDSIITGSIAGLYAEHRLAWDGTDLSGGDSHSQKQGPVVVAATLPTSMRSVWEWIPTPGSHLFQLKAGQSGASVTLKRSFGFPLVYTAEEIVRQNTTNT